MSAGSDRERSSYLSALRGSGGRHLEIWNLLSEKYRSKSRRASFGGSGGVVDAKGKECTKDQVEKSRLEKGSGFGNFG